MDFLDDIEKRVVKDKGWGLRLTTLVSFKVNGYVPAPARRCAFLLSAA